VSAVFNTLFASCTTAGGHSFAVKSRRMRRALVERGLGRRMIRVKLLEGHGFKLEAYFD
jgi:hypothetical protein